MNLHKPLLTGFLAVCTQLAWAQTAGHSDTVVTYLDDKYSPVAGLQGATYRRKAVLTDSLAGVAYTYSLDGWLVERQEYADVNSQIADGLDEEYHPQSKQLKTVCHFKQDKLEGELLSYYPNGRLKRREQYKAYVSQGGKCFDKAGKPMPFVPYIVLPEFRGGTAALMRFIGANLTYPLVALRADLEGRVFVTFIVDERGKVKNAKVVEPGHPSLDEEALRVVNLLPNWQPGRKEGVVKEVSFTLPIIFRIE